MCSERANVAPASIALPTAVSAAAAPLVSGSISSTSSPGKENDPAIADSAEAHEAPSSMLVEDPDKGRRIAGVRREYRLGRREKPTMGTRHTFDYGKVSIFAPEAS